MPIWERYDETVALSTVGAHQNTKLFTNLEDTDHFQNADVTIVDGIVTIITDTDDLCMVRLIIADELVTDAEINEDTPATSDRMHYYTWYCGRGPLIFRLRSKRTIATSESIWLNVSKALGANVTNIHVGLMLLFQLKH